MTIFVIRNIFTGLSSYITTLTHILNGTIFCSIAVELDVELNMLSQYIDHKVFVFCTIIMNPFLTSPAYGDAEKASLPTISVSSENCKNAFSDMTYEELKTKLETALSEKNKTLINLDFKTLQAQVDILSEHLLTTEQMETTDYLSALKKTSSYLTELENLLSKSKENAKLIKETHIIPLATMASLKSDYDSCMGLKTQFGEIFKQLSQLNKDFTEIQMISPQKIVAQRRSVNEMIEKIEESNKNETSQQAIASHLNFIQTQINTVTTTFKFDMKQLNIADLHAQQ